MGRPIKFRVWHEESKTWKVTDLCLHFINKIAEFWLSDKYIIEQYTGLKDKNGKEIYEGDIVRWFDDFEESASVSFDEGCFLVSWPINSERINGEMAGDLEVIGNIHENEELLGGEK